MPITTVYQVKLPDVHFKYLISVTYVRFKGETWPSL